MTVPACLAVDAEPLHRLETREDVFEHPGLNMVSTWLAVSGRRALKEGPRLAVLGGLQGLVKSVLTSPQINDLVVHRGQVNLRRHVVVLPAVVGANWVHIGHRSGWSFVSGHRGTSTPDSPGTRGTTLLARRQRRRPLG